MVIVISIFSTNHKTGQSNPDMNHFQWETETFPDLNLPFNHGSHCKAKCGSAFYDDITVLFFQILSWLSQFSSPAWARCRRFHCKWHRLSICTIHVRARKITTSHYHSAVWSKTSASPYSISKIIDNALWVISMDQRWFQAKVLQNMHREAIVVMAKF